MPTRNDLKEALRNAQLEILGGGNNSGPRRLGVAPAATVSPETQRYAELYADRMAENLYAFLEQQITDISNRQIDQRMPSRARTPASTTLTTQIINTTSTTASSSFVTLEQFGGIGDGVRNDWLPLSRALNTRSPVLLGPKTYYIQGTTLSVNSGCLITGHGASLSKLFTPTNDAILNVGGNDAEISNIGFIGTGRGTTYDAGSYYQHGIEINGYYRTRVNNCVFRSLGGAGVYVVSTVNNHEGTLINDCFFDSCNIGVKADTLGEYVNVNGSNINSCNYGFHISAGNFLGNGCIISNCNAGVYLNTGSNDGHGIINACEINHSVDYAVRSQPLTNGFTFSNCHMYYGNIYLEGSELSLVKGIRFTDCTIDVSNYFFQWCDGITFERTKIPAGLANTRYNNYASSTSCVLWQDTRYLASGSVLLATGSYNGGYTKVTTATLTYSASQINNGTNIAFDSLDLNSVAFHPTFTKYTFYDTTTGRWYVAGLGDGHLRLFANIRVDKNTADSFDNIYIYVRKNQAFYNYLQHSTLLGADTSMYSTSVTIPVNVNDQIDFVIGGSGIANSVSVNKSNTIIYVEGL